MFSLKARQTSEATLKTLIPRLSRSTAQRVLSLMFASSPGEVLKKLEKKGRITRLELSIFGESQTEVYDVALGDTLGYVTRWSEGRVTVTRWAGDYVLLMGVEDYEGAIIGEVDALNIYQRHCSSGQEN